MADEMGDMVDPIPPPEAPATTADQITEYGKLACFWIAKIIYIMCRAGCAVLCNRVVWSLLKIVSNVALETFIYLVLCACSFLIGIITNLDAYYTRGRRELRRIHEIRDRRTEYLRDEDLQKYAANVKRFVESPNYDFSFD